MDRIDSVEQLRELYPQAEPRAWRKDIRRIDAMCRRLIAASPLVMLASASRSGTVDVTPRGGPPGFVRVLDKHHLLLPDATGNRRLDTLSNVVEQPHAAMLFLIPGRETTLRVNGRAWVSPDPAVLEQAGAVGKPPQTVLVLGAQEVYAHCPKALIRSGVWEPGSWPEPAALPSSAEVTLAHLNEPELTLADAERREQASIRERLA